MTLPDFIKNEPARTKAIVMALVTLLAAFLPSNLHFDAQQQAALVSLALLILGGGEVVRQNVVPTNKISTVEKVEQVVKDPKA